MGKVGIELIEATDGLEGYMIDKKGIATMTSGFDKYVAT
jgi:thiamine biosynthesis lipoprotein ApbE